MTASMVGGLLVIWLSLQCESRVLDVGGCTRATKLYGMMTKNGCRCGGNEEPRAKWILHPRPKAVCMYVRQESGRKERRTDAQTRLLTRDAALKFATR